MTADPTVRSFVVGRDWHYLGDAPVTLRSATPVSVVFASASPPDHATPTFQGALPERRTFLETDKVFVRAVKKPAEVQVQQIRAGSPIAW